MDKNEQFLKMDELRNAMRNREFDKATEIADSLDLRKIKDNNFLSIAADAYERTRNYEDAKKTLEIAYENTNAGRLIAYKLCLISIKTKDMEGAKNYYDDFVEMAPRDTARYILKYRMARANGEPIEDLIAILEEYVNLDMEEKWAYELAKLYHKAGEAEKCVDICDEISLWFAEGKYVHKALELKQRHAPLTESQQKKYDESKMPEEGKPEHAEVKELQLEEKTVEKKKRRPFEINPDMAAGKTALKPEEHSSPDDVVEIHMNQEDAGEKESDDIKMSGDMEEIVLPNETGDEKDDENGAIHEKDREETAEAEEPKEEESARTEKLTGIKDVSDILRQLQERGILKAETVRQVVDIIDEAEEEPDTEETAESREHVQDVAKEARESIEHVQNTVKESKTAEEKETGDVEEQKEAVKTPVFDDSDIILEEELETDEPEDRPEENAPIMEEPEDMGSTRIFDKVQVLENGEILEQPKVSKVIKPPVQKEDREEQTAPQETDEKVPVFDLDFETPHRDESNDIGQKNMYENIAANSDLGYKTDKLPTREELQAAIKKAEAAVANKEENQETAGKTAMPDVKVKENPTSKVEILAGAGIVEEGEIRQTPAAEKTKAEPVPPRDVIKAEEKKTEKETSGVRQKETAATKPDIKNEKQKDVQTKAPKSGEPKNTVAGEDILSEAELTEFKNYLNVEGFESNIREVLQELIVNYVPNGKSDEGNVIIMGDEKTGKTTLAIEMIKLVNRKRGRRNRRLAKVDAGALNRKGFRYAITKLVGSDLIVENAEQLGKMTVSELIDVSGMFTDDMLIVLEGSTEGMEQLIKTSPRLESVFNHVVRIKEYDIKEWVEYGIKYAERKGYGVDELANLAFYKAIDDFFGLNKGIGQADVEGIIDKAIDKSGRIGRKVKGIFGSKTDEEGLKILQESDFDI